MSRILIAEDEESIASLLKYAFEREGYTVEWASDGYEATEKIPAFKPDLILLDIMMPNKDGYQVCREFASDYPVIMLTAKSDIVDKIAGMELGADDYITKPFDIREVVIRVKALLRRKNKGTSKVMKNGRLQILDDQKRVLLEGHELDLTPIEYSLILLMVQNLNKVFTRDELLDKVWGYTYGGETRSVDIHVQRIRRKLGDWEKHIKTIYGMGYQMTADKGNGEQIS